jgi:hypothetical protein
MLVIEVGVVSQGGTEKSGWEGEKVLEMETMRKWGKCRRRSGTRREMSCIEEWRMSETDIARKELVKHT